MHGLSVNGHVDDYLTVQNQVNALDVKNEFLAQLNIVEELEKDIVSVESGMSQQQTGLHFTVQAVKERNKRQKQEQYLANAKAELALAIKRLTQLKRQLNNLN